MNEENTLELSYDIKNTRKSYDLEEAKILGIADSLIDQRTEVVRSLESKVEQLSNKILRDVDHSKNWQPSDYLPDLSGEWNDDVKKMQKQCSALSDELLVVLVGDMITEECLPSYQTMLNRITATEDPTGTQDSAWGKWTRWWTAEENKHGDLLHTYLRFTEKLNMRAVESDIQHLLGRGFDPGVGNDPYKLLIYTSFQEKATHVSHLGTAGIAEKQGAEGLNIICIAIAEDELRHFSFYRGVMKEIFGADPNGAMTAYAQMMKKTISMPAKEMDSNRNPNLFTNYSEVAQAIGVYTANDYIEILEQLNSFWKISDRKVTTDEALQAQEYLLNLPGRYLKLAARRKNSEFRFDGSRFDWIKQ